MFKVVLLISFALYLQSLYVPLDQMRALSPNEQNEEQLSTTQVAEYSTTQKFFQQPLTPTVIIDKATDEERALRFLALIEKYTPLWKMFLEFGKEAIGGSFGSIFCVAVYKAFRWCMSRRRKVATDNIELQNM